MRSEKGDSTAKILFRESNEMSKQFSESRSIYKGTIICFDVEILLSFFSVSFRFDFFRKFYSTFNFYLR